MSFISRFGDEPGASAGRSDFSDGETQDLELEQALKNFRLSVCAWGEAEYSRARPARKIVRRRSLRPALGWALGCAMLGVGFSGGIYRRQELAKIAAERAAEHQRQAAAEQKVREARAEDEDLLATVDSDVSREVPSAMEPLAQLMAGEDAK